MHRFELTVLGTGSALPTNNRHPSAQLLNIAERFFLIDCGEGTQTQLRKYKLSFSRIDAIFISHLHGDHYFGLIGLLQSFHLLGRQKKIKIFGPEPIQGIIELQNRVSYTDLNYEIEFISTKDDSLRKIYEDNKLEVYSFPLNHKIPCTGFLFKEKPFPKRIIKERLSELNISISEIHKLKAGLDAQDDLGNIVRANELTLDSPPPRSFAYCSDTCYYEKIVEIVKGVNLLYHESTFLEDLRDRAKQTMHSTAKDAAKIASMAGVQKLLIGHFSSRYDDENLFEKEAKEIFENTMLASEGKVFPI